MLWSFFLWIFSLMHLGFLTFRHKNLRCQKSYPARKNLHRITRCLENNKSNSWGIQFFDAHFAKKFMYIFQTFIFKAIKLFKGGSRKRALRGEGEGIPRINPRRNCNFVIFFNNLVMKKNVQPKTYLLVNMVKSEHFILFPYTRINFKNLHYTDTLNHLKNWLYKINYIPNFNWIFNWI